MSTPEERQARADAIEAQLAAETTDDSIRSEIAQASVDALTDMLDPVVLRVRSFIRRAASPDNPNTTMRSFANAWLAATDGLVSEAQKEAQQFAASQQSEPNED